MTTPSPPRAVGGAARELAAGFGSLWTGFGFWRHHVGTMMFGLLPAAIAGIVLFGGLAALLVFIDPVAAAITPFAETWDAGWRVALRVVVGTALVIGAGVLSARVFTALALTIGGPIYERIGTIVDESYGEVARAEGPGFWRSLGDMSGIVARSVLGAAAIFLIGLVPVVGSIASAVIGVIFTATIISREFTLQAMQVRGMDAGARRAVHRRWRWRRLGFGLAVQLCYLVPLGAVLSMPAAVAGGTHLARRMLGEPVGPSDAPGGPQAEGGVSKRPISD
ncbi:EI24 domain-containing protein [Protaetiibacter sp. SSC-01]|uniref:EI24 domain-containing protein n=1 Tax=Protaetiibacter sp. SSC-01 TaxID=2759943 RepID=UPI0016572035|nr:EI24 domain-containing protein [Protaetiibacter sp. SSC-01]QNO38152.1 EI24 domain-containing protein [Protaetiibacter sp. SSC-01]